MGKRGIESEEVVEISSADTTPCYNAAFKNASVAFLPEGQGKSNGRKFVFLRFFSNYGRRRFEEELQEQTKNRVSS